MSKGHLNILLILTIARVYILCNIITFEFIIMNQGKLTAEMTYSSA